MQAAELSTLNGEPDEQKRRAWVVMKLVMNTPSNGWVSKRDVRYHGTTSVALAERGVEQLLNRYQEVLRHEPAMGRELFRVTIGMLNEGHLRVPPRLKARFRMELEARCLETPRVPMPWRPLA